MSGKTPRQLKKLRALGLSTMPSHGVGLSAEDRPHETVPTALVKPQWWQKLPHYANRAQQKSARSGSSV